MGGKVRSSSRRTLVWFRGKDLRLADHEPLRSALADGEVVLLFVIDPYFFAEERARRIAHRMQYLVDSLAELAAAIAGRGSRLILASGKSVDVVPELCARWKIDRLVAQRWSEPFGRERDDRIARAIDIPFDLFEGEILHPPGSILTGQDRPYSVFTPFARALRTTIEVADPLPAPRSLPPPPHGIDIPDVDLPTCESLGITRNQALLAAGERAAHRRLRQFVNGPASQYQRTRDFMAEQGTSRLSADLKFGTVSVRTVWHAVADIPAPHRTVFRNQLIWRDFAHDILWHRPEVLSEPFRASWHDFPWRNDEDDWSAWQLGQTGYPIVDASARQLLHEGFVHNRARMISASFLTKHLLIDYRRGEEHYLRHLVDGDWANNNMGWQWSAGCGCDAQPYFRVFNPMSQGVRFDPDGDYVRRWLPELADMPSRYIHEPWRAPTEVQGRAGVVLGDTYPHPIVDHDSARQRFLAVARSTLR